MQIAGRKSMNSKQVPYEPGAIATGTPTSDGKYSEAASKPNPRFAV
jgi:hypothetical protein